MQLFKQNAEKTLGHLLTYVGLAVTTSMSFLTLLANPNGKPTKVAINGIHASSGGLCSP